MGACMQYRSVKSNLEQSFLALINAPGFQPYRKVFIHDIKNLAHTLNYGNFFDIPNLFCEDKLFYKPELVPNHQIHGDLRSVHPDRLPGVGIPLDVLEAPDLEAAQLLISVQDGFSCKQGFGTTIALRFQTIGIHKWQYIHITPKELELSLEHITQISV